MSRLDYYDGGRLVRVPDLSVPAEITQCLAGPDKDYITCPSCDGQGERGISQDYWGNWNTKQCWACDGMGEVTPDDAIDIRERMNEEQS